MLSREEIREIDEEIGILPRRRSACIEALKAVQRHRGWVSDVAVRDVAEYLEMSPHEVDSIATFYSLIFRRPVGRHVVLLCDSVSCWILGCDRLARELGERLGVAPGGTTPDDRFTLLPMACLGACERAPALMIDRDLHGDVRPEQLGELLDRYE